jgi:hypothetical protein
MEKEKGEFLRGGGWVGQRIQNLIRPYWQVLAAVYGPHDMRDSRLRPSQDKVVVNCQYSMAVFRYTSKEKGST